MKKITTTSAIAVALFLMLSTTSCKNNPEVNIPLIDYILIEEAYLDVKSGLVEYDDSMAMSYNNDMQLVGIDGLYEDYDLFYDDAERLSRVEVFNNQTKAEYSYFIEYTWASNTVTVQEYNAPNEPTWYKTVITFDGNDNIEKIEYFDQPNKAEWYLNSYMEFSYTNNNLVLYERYYPELLKSSAYRQHSFRKSPPLGGPSEKGQLAPFLVAKSEVTYDSKTNPFIIYPGLALLFSNEMPHIFTSTNNPTFASNAEYIEGTYTWDVDFSYVFDNKGFPIEIVQFESYDNWDYMETWTIAYK